MGISSGRLPDGLVRVVSLAEARFGMERNDIQCLPVAGFWMPASELVSIGIVFTNRLPLDYDGNVMWPRPTATSRNDKELCQILGLKEGIYAEIWAGQFDFDVQCFRLTVPEEAHYVLLYAFSADGTPVKDIEAYVDTMHALWGEGVSFLEPDGSKINGCIAVLPADDLEELLERHGENYQRRLARAKKALQYTTNQCASYRRNMENLMSHAVKLNWGWQPLTDFAIVYYIDGDGIAAQETFSYTARDANYLRDLICIAEEAVSGGVT